MSHPRSIILDYDETITPRYTDKNRIFAEAAARLLVTFHAASQNPMELHEAVKLVEQSVADHGTELEIVRQLTGMDSTEIYLGYHENAFDDIARYLAPDADLKAALQQAANSHNLVIYSHGPQFWVERGLEKLGLRDVFSPEATFGLNHPTVNFRHKNRSADAYLDVIGGKHGLEQATLIDDAIGNIIFADKLGLNTVHINHEMRDIHWPRSAPDLKTALTLL